MRAPTIALLIFVSSAAAAETPDPCAATSAASDVQFTIALKDHGPVFEYGEIIPLALTFTSSTKNRYWADDRNYDRSGRLGIEQYCLEPDAPDPLATYFRTGAFMGGALGSERMLGSTPFIASAELNEYRSPGPGHYRLYAVTQRVWRTRDAGENANYERVDVPVRSNSIDFQVNAPNPAWQAEQLRNAVETLTGAGSPEDARAASRRLRFLNTKGSTKQLARLFGLKPEQFADANLMFGLYGSPYRQLALDSMHAELSVPEHPVTPQFLGTLVNLQIGSDPAWDWPQGLSDGEAQAFGERRQAHLDAVMSAEVQAAAEALPRKIGRARALTLHGLLTSGHLDSHLAEALRPLLAAAWPDLPAKAQGELIQFRWPLVAGPEMAPVLRKMMAEPSSDTTIHNAALKHLFEMDPAAGREAILRDLRSANAQPSPDVLALLPKEDIAPAVQPAVERIRRHENDRELDYQLIDRYADASFVGAVQAAYEERQGEWACAPQSAMLRYFLRVDPDLGAREVTAAMRERKDTGCYQYQLQELGAELPKLQQIAIDALDDADPEVARNAAEALQKWGGADAEPALWARLRRFHEEWAGQNEQLRSAPPYDDAGSRAVMLEVALASAIGMGANWICGPDKLARLHALVWTKQVAQQVEAWAGMWKQGAPVINPAWFPDDTLRFSVLQYDALNEEQLLAKVAQLPSGTHLTWQFYAPGQISPPVSLEKQEAVYQRVRTAAAQHGLVIARRDC
ncbi:MAG TPA: hypothetical protein VFA04_08615 [Bryobacteraceae bacterium]|nr:hypothetical protein [Bryobacteraceae bacterium]